MAHSSPFDVRSIASESAPMNRRLLLLSNSRDPQGRYLEHAKRHIRAFLDARVHSVLFIPFASVGVSWNQYEERARVPFLDMGYSLISIHSASDPLKALRTVEAIVVGGATRSTCSTSCTACS